MKKRVMCQSGRASEQERRSSLKLFLNRWVAYGKKEFTGPRSHKGLRTTRLPYEGWENGQRVFPACIHC
jgi:hypothetical protein